MPARGEQRLAAERSSAEELWERLQARHPFPLTVALIVTERCHLRCGHCFVPPPTAEDALTADELTALLDELAGLGVLRLLLTGGEPTLRPDLLELVARARERRFVVNLKTSGTRLAVAQVDRLAALGVAQLDLSLYHPDPAPHDEFVGRAGAWERTVATGRRFVERGGKVRVAYNVMQWNWQQVPRFLDWCEAQGFAYLVNPQLLARRESAQTPDTLRPTEDQLRAVMSDPRLLRAASLVGASSPAPDRALCGAGHSMASIQPNGEVWMCQMLPLGLGNVRRASFRDLWLGSPVRQAFLARRFGDLADCTGCVSAGLCTRCSANALAEHGDLLGVSAADCVVARARAALVRPLEQVAAVMTPSPPGPARDDTP